MRNSRHQWLLTIALCLVCWLGLGVNPANALTPSPTLALGNKPLFSFAGNRPGNLGITDGKLLPCPSTPNCVNSQTPASDAQHAIAPLSVTQSPEQTWETLKTVVASQARTEIVDESDRYLYAEFTSALMGFVDDVEFYLEPSEQVIHVRSASRLGESDLGVNRQRIEAIRVQLNS